MPWCRVSRCIDLIDYRLCPDCRTGSLLWRNAAQEIFGDHYTLRSDLNQLGRIHLCIVDLKRCIREAREENESSALSLADQTRVLELLEQTLHALRLRVDDSHLPPRS